MMGRRAVSPRFTPRDGTSIVRSDRIIPRLSLLAGLALLATTGCSVLTPLVPGSAPVHTVDPNAPFVVVTVGGIPVATPTAGEVAPTIPDSTPLPKAEVPVRETTPRPVASPSLNRGASAAAQANRPPEASIPTMPASPVAAGQ
jgi:hypothetical protein